MERARKLGLDNSTGDLVTQPFGYFLLGEPKEVRRIVAMVAGRPDEFQVTQCLGCYPAVLRPVPQGGSDHPAGF